MSWVRRHFEHLRRWREYAAAVARAARDLVPGAKVYVVGGVAKGRITVLSDIDILIVVPKGAERRGLSRAIMARAMDVYGLPWDAPVELHIADEDGAGSYLEGAAVEV